MCSDGKAEIKMHMLLALQLKTLYKTGEIQGIIIRFRFGLLLQMEDEKQHSCHLRCPLVFKTFLLSVPGLPGLLDKSSSISIQLSPHLV